MAFNSSGEMLKQRFEINVEGGDVENCDEIAVDFVDIDGSNIAYRAEVEARAYNCSGGIVERLFGTVIVYLVTELEQTPCLLPNLDSVFIFL